MLQTDVVSTADAYLSRIQAYLIIAEVTTTKVPWTFRFGLILLDVRIDANLHSLKNLKILFGEIERGAFGFSLVIARMRP